MASEMRGAPTGPFDIQGMPTKWWIEWAQLVFRLLFGLTESGTTANRPTTGLWVGRMYFDTSLNKPIWVGAINPTVWRDGAGTDVT